MLTTGQKITGVVGLIYVSVFSVAGVLGHGPDRHEQETSGQICEEVLSTAKKTSVTNKLIARALNEIKVGVQKSGLEKLGWLYIKQAREESNEHYLEYGHAVARCLLHNDSDSLAGKLLLGHTLHQQHQFKAAEEVARELVAKRGYWFDHALLGDVLLEVGDLPGAIAAYDAMVSQRPSAQSFVRIAQLRWLSGDLDGAIAAARHALNAVSGPKEHVAWIQTKLAELLFFDGQMEAAMVGSKNALKISPDYPQALTLQGRLLLAQNKPKAAAVVLRNTLARVSLPETQWLLIEALSTDDRQAHAEEIQALTSALLANPEDPRTVSLFVASHGLSASQALTLAEEEFRKRQDAQSLDALAWALFAAGDSRRADRYSQRALKHGLVHGRFFLHAALIKLDQGDIEAGGTLLGNAKGFSYQLLPSERVLLEEAQLKLDKQRFSQVL